MEKQGILVKGGKYVKFMDFGKQEIQEKEGLQKKTRLSSIESQPKKVVVVVVVVVVVLFIIGQKT